MVNPYEPKIVTEQPATTDWRFAAVTLVCIGCLVLDAPILIGRFMPSINVWFNQHVGFGGYLFVCVMLSSWYWQQDGVQWATLFLLFMAMINAWTLYCKGTVAAVVDPHNDILHSAWFLSVLLPLVFALALALTDRFSPARLSQDKAGKHVDASHSG